ncbi:expressed unknown protein [Seminavis robusta]|uniref:Uncharacterized protein n=1 Tax=Seminavis robusta TaxID=568900 RepID=A0A9N8F6D1_9STRA|nr:expressed unknown protein [Seminavis robusta]|eukprot:Sro4340_g353780.1 n/a (552) ;mRNA; r:25-1821
MKLTDVMLGLGGLVVLLTVMLDNIVLAEMKPTELWGSMSIKIFGATTDQPGGINATTVRHSTRVGNQNQTNGSLPNPNTKRDEWINTSSSSTTSLSTQPPEVLATPAPEVTTTSDEVSPQPTEVLPTSMAKVIPTTEVSTQPPELVLPTSSMPLNSSMFKVPKVSNDWEKLKQQNPKIIITFLQNSGLGSQILNMLAQKIFFDSLHRTFIADDTIYGYRWDEETGVLRGFFQPKFPVVNKDEYATIERVFGVENYRKAIDASKKKTWPDYTSGKQIGRVSDKTQLYIVWSTSGPARRAFRKRFEAVGPEVYQRFADCACDNLQFSDHALFEINQLKEALNMPDLTKSHSVAFHIRRGDKLEKEAKKPYTAYHYVDKLRRIPDAARKPVEHCFVASDDYSVVGELQQALQSKGIHCQLHTLIPSVARGANLAYKTSGHEDTILLLAELTMMIDATYWVGTWNSNAGNMASVMRGCRHAGKPHYSHSYALDGEDWFFRGKAYMKRWNRGVVEIRCSAERWLFVGCFQHLSESYFSFGEEEKVMETGAPHIARD